MIEDDSQKPIEFARYDSENTIEFRCNFTSFGPLAIDLLKRADTDEVLITTDAGKKYKARVKMDEKANLVTLYDIEEVTEND